MHLERLVISGFQCFGPAPCIIDLAQSLSALVGTNGAGKTAAMRALQRLFGSTADDRRVRRRDFHVPIHETDPPRERSFYLEAVLGFPELNGENGDHSVVPEFFHQMAADEAGRLRCRLHLDATWTDDGSLEGAIDVRLRAVRTFGDYEETDCVDVKAIDRSRVQLVYVPAARDAASQVGALLRGRLWRAISWSEGVRTCFRDSGQQVNDAFNAEPAIGAVARALVQRWTQVYGHGEGHTPHLRAVDLRFEEFVRRTEVAFRPDETGGERSVDELSDGQRSLFHIAMVSCALDVERGILDGSAGDGFMADKLAIPALTLVMVEEPENNLAPFYLSRIVGQLRDIASQSRAQAVISSHSASILARVDPRDVRHFRLTAPKRTTLVRSISLPTGDEEAEKYVRDAVRTFPELYFARFVVLGEGASEVVVLPRLAEALDLRIDPSFVAIVPLGGRHVNHLWRLLTDLQIPYSTLLDLDLGRNGGGWGRIKTTCSELLNVGYTPSQVFGAQATEADVGARLGAFDSWDVNDLTSLNGWLAHLRTLRIHFCIPLDLDHSLLHAYPAAYRSLPEGLQGPDESDPRPAVLGARGQNHLYSAADALDALRWYRYLFLGRGKPGTHVRVLSAMDAATLRASMPEPLLTLLQQVAAATNPGAEDSRGS
jgi:hypothetical protein